MTKDKLVTLESPDLKELFEKASTVRENSYSPYSNYKVGAAIRTKDGRVYTGCNVENSSYGATVCAERVAIQKAVSEHGHIEISEVMVVTHASPPWPPCGMCRQVIAEFGENPKIYTANPQGDLLAFSLHDIFPQAFTPDHLK
jgi:cytidine deaminase